MLRDLTEGRRTLGKWLAVRRFRRRFRKAPKFALGELPEDMHGRVTASTETAGETLYAPISGRRCVYWVIEVVEDLGEDWPSTLILSAQRGVPFLLVEDGHRALVDPERADVSLLFDHENRSSGATHADKNQQAVLAEYLAHRDFTHTVTLLYREAIIEVGEAVSILGSGTREPDPDAPPTAAYREGGPTRLRLTSSEKYPLAITDDPRCA